MEVVRNNNAKVTYELKLDDGKLIFSTQTSDISIANIEVIEYLNKPAAREFRAFRKNIFINGVYQGSFSGLTLP